MKDMFLNEDYLIDAIPGLYDFFMPEESIFDIMPRFLEMSFWIQIMYYFVGFMSFVQNRRVPHVYRFHVLQAMVLDIFWLVMSGFISLTEIAPLDYFSGSLTGELHQMNTDFVCCLNQMFGSCVAVEHPFLISDETNITFFVCHIHL